MSYADLLAADDGNNSPLIIAIIGRLLQINMNIPDPDHLWHKVDVELEAAAPGEQTIHTIEVAGKKICITRFQDKYYGFAYLCPHASGIMANGRIDDNGNVACPVHKYKFSIKNGRNITGEGYYLKTYMVEIRDAGIFVRL